MHDMWKLFPRILEHKINGLLLLAEPSPTKAYQLYKSCQFENVWSSSFTHFTDNLRRFYLLDPDDRSKGQIDSWMERPIHKSLYEQFRLNFRNAVVNPSAVTGLAGWIHQVMRLNLQTESQIISTDVMKKTLDYVTQPPPYEKAENVEFSDFCNAWRRMVFNLFGRRYDDDLNKILRELQALEKEQQLRETSERFIPQIYLTQTEIDWTESVRVAAEDFQTLPKFPLARGPQKTRLAELERAVKLYNIILHSDKPDLAQHRSNVRATILHRCEELLRSCSR